MDKEQFALKLSVAGSVFMALLGIGFAIQTRSEAIMLDGLFSLITFIMSLLTLKVASLIHKGESPRFQFGYNNFEPLLNMVKGLIILTLSVFALASSVSALLHGGARTAVRNADFILNHCHDRLFCCGVGVEEKQQAHSLAAGAGGCRQLDD